MISKSWKSVLALLLAVCLCLGTFLTGCRNQQQEDPETQPPTGDSTVAEDEGNGDEEEDDEWEDFEDEYTDVEGGKIALHTKGKNGDLGIYFTMEPNDIPVDTSWKTEYRPASPNAIILYRDGEQINLGNTMTGMVIKYSDTEYYLKLEKWNIGKNFPIRDGDVLLVDGDFRNSEQGIRFHLGPTYISVEEGLVFFSDEYPTGSNVNVRYVGALSSHPNGKNSNGIYFSLPANGLPYNGWSLEYSPTSESCVQLIRDGKTYNIGNKAAGTIVKYGETDYYLKMEQWIIKDVYPVRDGDIIVVSGKFVNSGAAAVFSISKTYISVEEGLLSFSEEYPTESNIEAVQIPTLLEHPNGFTGTGVYFKSGENSLPFDGWSVEYFPREAACIKLIRGEETFDIANPDAGTIVKYNETDYYLKLEQWIYKNYFPFVDGDIIVMEGKFVNSGLAALMEIGKTYISIQGGMAYFTTEYPTGDLGPTKIEGTGMSSHPNGWNKESNGGLSFILDSNEAPFAADWSLRYTPTTAGTVKLVRDGATYDVANTGAEMLVKYRENEYYLEFWPIQQKPIVDGDMLIIEGGFVNAANNVVLTIEKTYITFENGEATFSKDGPDVIQAGYMQPHDKDWNTDSNDGLYFKLSVNELPYNGWDIEYEPVSATSIQLIRGGETYNVGLPSRGTIVKYGDTDYYLKLSTWTIGDYAPIVPGDVLVVEGQFQNKDNGKTFAISRSVITVDEDYTLTFAEEEATDKVIKAGAMSSHPNGWNTSNNKGMYFTLASNEVPFADDWTTYYFPTAAENVKLIRGGQTLEIAQTDREFIVKYGETDYYLKLEKWTIGDNYPIVPGDVLIVEGKFTNPVLGVEFSIDTTYITVGENYVLTFSETAPEQGEPEKPESHGPMKANGTNGWTGTGGLYFTMESNNLPYNSWSLRYVPTANTAIKLIRGGVETNVANTAAETIVKYSDTEYYMEFWPVSLKPLQAGDVMIVEGSFYNAANDATLNIAKTTITFNADGTATFASEGVEPEDPEITEPDATEPENHGQMAAHSVNGWTGTGGLYFTMAANDIPYNSWNVRYTPTLESNVKLIRNGTTYNVAHTQRETIVKYSDTEYYFEFWTLADYKPVKAGDVLVVEGDFVNAGNGAKLSIAKTFITFNADGTATFSSDISKPEEPDAPETPESEGLPLLAWSEKAWNTGSNGGFWFTMDANDIPADDTWALEYRPVSEDVIKLVRGGETVNIAIPGRGTIVKASEAEYYLKLEWNIGDYSKKITVGDSLIVEGDFTNETNGVTFTVSKTVITIGENYELTFVTEEDEPESNVIQAGAMIANASGVTDTIIYFSLADNELPYSISKSDFRPVNAGVIQLMRDGEVYQIGDPNAKTIVKQTAAGKYRLLRGALTMELQAGDILIVEGEFVGGNTNEETVYHFGISKTYILVGEGEVSFSTELPSEE